MPDASFSARHVTIAGSEPHEGSVSAYAAMAGRLVSVWMALYSCGDVPYLAPATEWGKYILKR